MDLQLKNKKALVSGSTAGIGYAIAVSLAKEGAHVIINGRQQDSVDKAIAQIKQEAGVDVVGFAGDLSQAHTAELLANAYP
ncbi:MAG TPA: SDR family NAD(P)-dependent oxidoreductase, partial [Methylophaga sp.]|nr:SDR family NAD(P)-dependent oxidoreductase [Methylophaga sp.]